MPRLKKLTLQYLIRDLWTHEALRRMHRDVATIVRAAQLAIEDKGKPGSIGPVIAIDGRLVYDEEATGFLPYYVEKTENERLKVERARQTYRRESQKYWASIGRLSRGEEAPRIFWIRGKTDSGCYDRREWTPLTQKIPQAIAEAVHRNPCGGEEGNDEPAWDFAVAELMGLCDIEGVTQTDFESYAEALTMREVVASTKMTAMIARLNREEIVEDLLGMLRDNYPGVANKLESKLETDAPKAIQTSFNAAVDSSSKEFASQIADTNEGSLPGDRVREKSDVPLHRCAVGCEHGRAFQTFTLFKDEWKHRRRVEFAEGHESNLIKALAGGGGKLSKKDAIRIVGSRIDANYKFYGTVKSCMSRIRKAIREAFELQKEKDPIPFRDGAYQAAIRIGYAITDDSGSLVFRLVDQLNRDECLDHHPHL